MSIYKKHILISIMLFMITIFAESDILMDLSDYSIYSIIEKNSTHFGIVVHGNPDFPSDLCVIQILNNQPYFLTAENNYSYPFPYISTSKYIIFQTNSDHINIFDTEKQELIQVVCSATPDGIHSYNNLCLFIQVYGPDHIVNLETQEIVKLGWDYSQSDTFFFDETGNIIANHKGEYFRMEDGVFTSGEPADSDSLEEIEWEHNMIRQGEDPDLVKYYSELWGIPVYGE